MAMERTKQLKFYCPQRSWGKVIFLHMYVILFMGDVCLSACWDTHLLPGADPPPRSRHPLRADTPTEQTPNGSRHPPEQCMLGDMGNKQVVCILLECNLVSIAITLWMLQLVTMISIFSVAIMNGYWTHLSCNKDEGHGFSYTLTSSGHQEASKVAKLYLFIHVHIEALMGPVPRIK